MGKLFLQHTCLAEFEIMMQMVPRYIRKETMPENITYLEMLHRTVNDYQIRGLYKKIKKLTEGGDEYVMLFINTNHKNRFNNFYKHAEKRNWNVIKSNRNLAALFLLSGNEHLWKQIKSIVDEDTIDLKQVDIHSSIDDILNQAKKIKFADNSDNSELVIREIGILLGKTKEVGEYEWDIDYTKSVYAHLLNKNKVRQAHTVWTLINLGYADSVLAPSERKVIDYLVSVWEMNELLSSTLFDIAETILALQMKKEWVLSTNKSDDEKDKMCADIDEEMKKMYDDVELTISEANI